MLSRLFGLGKKAASSDGSDARLDRQTPIIVDLARTFLSAVHEMEPHFSRAFFRYDRGPSDHCVKASIQTGEGVDIVDVLAHKPLFAAMGPLGTALFQAQGRESGVFLLIVSSPADYEILFDFDSRERWQISKMGGGTGLPEGL